MLDGNIDARVGGGMSHLHVELEKHQSDAARLLGSAVKLQWPIIILEVESKVCPGEKVKVLAVSLIDMSTRQNIIVPLARLFEEQPMDVCYAPHVEGAVVSPIVVDVLEDVYGTLKGWEFHI